MADNCTIFSRRADYSAALESARDLSLKITTEGIEERWTKIVLRDGTATLSLSSLESRYRGDHFSHIALGLLNVLRKNCDLRLDILATITEAKFAIGVVAEPNLMQTQFLRYICDTARRLEGIIFLNGNQLLDFDGNTLAGPW